MKNLQASVLKTVRSGDLTFEDLSFKDLSLDEREGKKTKERIIKEGEKNV